LNSSTEAAAQTVGPALLSMIDSVRKKYQYLL